jgi:SAM-dependent methyltransferase
MSRNYSFAVHLAAHFSPPPASLLDFGCGAGQLIDEALAAGYDAHGVDTFERDWAKFHPPSSRVRKIETGSTLPFDANTFDVVTANQVFEHVEDLETAATQIARVVKPGAILIALMPTSETMWEPHLKAPFPHWFANGSMGERFCLRAGLFISPRPTRVSNWMAFGTRYLRSNVYYRSTREYVRRLGPHFQLLSQEEPAWLRFRFGRVADALPGIFARELTRRAAGCVLVFKRVHQTNFSSDSFARPHG